MREKNKGRGDGRASSCNMGPARDSAILPPKHHDSNERDWKGTARGNVDRWRRGPQSTGRMGAGFNRKVFTDDKEEMAQEPGGRNKSIGV